MSVFGNYVAFVLGLEWLRGFFSGGIVCIVMVARDEKGALQ